MKKTVIIGTGRSGTTFLVHLLTAVGLDTGYEVEDLKDLIDKKSNAGLERSMSSDCGVIKNPRLSNKILHYKGHIGHAIIPFRTLRQAAMSRVNNGIEGIGGTWNAYDQKTQEQWLLRVVYEMMLQLSVSGTPFTLLHFPTLTKEPAHVYNRLHWLLSPVVDEKAFEDIFWNITKHKKS